ncbi:hypothetical protein V8C86DRAFT_1751988 [Haematococcus lacustris]
MGTPRARELHVPAPHPRAPSDALDLKTLEERLREFKAENQLLGRTLQEVQAERSALERQVQDGVRSAVQLQGELDASRQACSALQTEAEGLRARLAAQEAKLQQVTASRAEVEELVLDLHQLLALQGPDAQPAGQQRGDSSQLRDQMARMEELYQSKLQLVQQQSAERVRLLEQEHAQALSRVQATSLTLVSQLRQEAAKQVEEAQAGIERQAGGRASRWRPGGQESGTDEKAWGWRAGQGGPAGQGSSMYRQVLLSGMLSCPFWFRCMTSCASWSSSRSAAACWRAD